MQVIFSGGIFQAGRYSGNFIMFGALQIERSLAVVAETTITGTVNLMQNSELIFSGKFI